MCNQKAGGYALGYAEFGQTYLKTINKEYPNDNFATCPVGVLLLLYVLLGSGATRGKTGCQIASTLKLRNQCDEFKRTLNESTAMYQSFENELKTVFIMASDGRERVMEIANAIFVQQNYTILETFKNRLKDKFGARISQVNFNNRRYALAEMNQWIYEATKGKLQHFFRSENDINPNARFIMFNVFLFKDNWYRGLTSIGTGEFSVEAGRRYQVDMMNIIERMPYVDMKDEGFSMIKKPLQNSRFSFVIMLPNQKFNLKSIETFLNGGKFIGAVRMETKLVNLTMPKFKLTFDADLIPTMKKMGITDLFNAKIADLSGATNEFVYMGMMKQAVTLNVDERGVEATAVTAAGAVPVSFWLPDVSFHVVHPFYCFIYDEDLMLPLVAARMVDPTRI